MVSFSMVLIAVPVSAADLANVAMQCGLAKAQGADLIELRLDQCAQQGADLKAIIAGIKNLPLPVIATIRHQSEGGFWAGSESERMALFAAADQAGAKYIDCELAFSAGLQPRANAKLILSYHDFAGMGPDPQELVARMRAAGADVAKIAVTPSDADEIAPIEALYHLIDFPLIAIAMGDFGLPTRLLAGAWGAHLTYARLESDKGSAPGQPVIGELLRMYRIKAQGKQTHIYGIIGNPIEHSLSPLVHNTAFAHQGIDAVYVPFLCKDAKKFWAACGDWIDGLSITMPHKQELIDAVDSIEKLAMRIGAINTIYRDENNETIGANTDAGAAVTCLERQCGTLQGLHALILGAGGVSRAIAFALVDRGAKVTIVNRTLDRAQELAAEVGAAALAADAPMPEYDILINGTAVGMGIDAESPWPKDAHRPRSIVFDTVYTPLETKLIKEAQMADAVTICGLSMFIAQAQGQYNRWTNTEAPEALMHRVALERLGGREATSSQKKYNTAVLQRRLDGGA